MGSPSSDTTRALIACEKREGEGEGTGEEEGRGERGERGGEGRVTEKEKEESLPIFIQTALGLSSL